MTWRGIVAIGAAVALGAGCFPFEAENRHLDGPYRLFAADLREDTRLCYDIGGGACVGRVGPTVFAAGWDEHFVITKRHPIDDRTRVEYFILDRAKDTPAADPQASVMGPFTEQEFGAARQRLNVDPKLTFAVVLRHLQ